MSTLNSEKLIIAFHKLSNFLLSPDEDFNSVIRSAPNHNAWFTVEEVTRSLASLQEMLQLPALEKWFENISVTSSPKKVGLILAGNIPMVGFHDVLSVLATGNIALIKLSSSDSQLLPALLKKLVSFEPLLQDQIEYVERLTGFDAIIATGSNNTSRYFEYYFGKVPNIIRKNRNSVAVLDGRESVAEIAALGHDIFDYFGLGCRNVSKVYLPEGYEIKNFFEPLESFSPVINHFKYNNNYDYNKSIYLVNSVTHFDNGFLLVKQDEGLTSPLAVLFTETYTDLDALSQQLEQKEEQIQCVLTQTELKFSKGTLTLGQGQHPALWDYADHVDTIAFLNGLQTV
ncbi:acyl-CoA reductase [Pedobacter antarcticus 4BY]|uniref:Acyl-CoA reductase n=2 Tax=Pedobacter antarcticus TaxID=34086 RepID=A0A081PFD3_9SPHI|nr:acyl-CoA reductase [Pedobacter antarcticus]KEQ29406.1 acyl-CoA reductase [Pedobacter antarcticus 4BY]SFF40098.1 Acyl-CoA reductase (LuxC) [Pedobacter antarcticus]